MDKEIKERIAAINSGIIPEGYKKTKVGIVPVEWETKTLGQVLQRVSNAVNVENDIQYQQIGIRSHGKGLFYKEKVSGAELGNKSVFWIEPDCFILNIVFAWEQAIGKTTKNEIGMIASHRFPMYKPQGIDIDYLVFYFLTKRGNTLLELASPGGAGRNKTLGQENFLNSKVILPPLPEQKKIAEIISTQDKLIELQEKKIEQLKELKKAYLQKMFPQKGSKYPELRFKGFTDPWEQRKFSDFTFAAGERNKDDLDLEPFAITNNQGFIAQSEVHDDFGYMKDVDRKMYIVVKPNSFAYNPARINVGSLGYYEGAENVIVSSLYEVFQTAEYVDDKFLKHWFKTKAFQDWIERLQEGSVRLYFYYDKLCECIMSMPSVEEQRKIGAYLDKIDNLITLHQRKSEQEKQKKKALMQLLLTGIVRTK